MTKTPAFALLQIPANEVQVGMIVIPTGRKQKLEVITADNWSSNGDRVLGCYGKGLSVHHYSPEALVTVVI